MGISIIDQVIEEVRTLPRELQWRVLEFTRKLSRVSRPRRVSGATLLSFAGQFSVDEAEEMRHAIEDGCEQIDVHEW